MRLWMTVCTQADGVGVPVGAGMTLSGEEQ
jgi:hypothetical protein